MHWTKYAIESMSQTISFQIICSTLCECGMRLIHLYCSQGSGIILNVKRKNLCLNTNKTWMSNDKHLHSKFTKFTFSFCAFFLKCSHINTYSDSCTKGKYPQFQKWNENIMKNWMSHRLWIHHSLTRVLSLSHLIKKLRLNS